MNPADYNRLQSDYFSASVNYSRTTQMAEEVDDYDGSDQIEFATEALEETNKTCNQFKIIENHILRMMDELSPNHSVYRILQDLLADVQKKIGWSTLVLQRYKNLIANSDALGSFAEGLEFKTKYGHIPEEILDRLAGLDEEALDQVRAVLGGGYDESEEDESYEEEPESEETEESDVGPEEEGYEPEILVPTGEGELFETDPAHLFGNVDREGQPEEVLTWEDPKKVEDDEPESIAAEEHEEESEEEAPETAESTDDQPMTEVIPQGEMICTQCGGLFDPSKGVGKINGYYYCPVCYQMIAGEPGASEEMAQPVSEEPAPKKRIIRKRTTKKKPAKKTTKRGTRKTAPKKEDSE